MRAVSSDWGGLTFNRKNNLIYAVDAGGHRIVALDREGKQLLEIGERGGGSGEFNFPSHITSDPEGLLYVTDSKAEIPGEITCEIRGQPIVQRATPLPITPALARIGWMTSGSAER